MAHRIQLSIACLALCASGAVHAQSYPDKPVRIVVTSSAGAASDMLARIMADQLGKALHQPFVVENRPGAGGNIAGDYVARSPADGYTLLLASVSSHGINAALYARMPYDPRKDFAPIIALASNPNAVVVAPASGIDSVKDLIARAKAKPGELTFSSGGNGTSQHLAGELFESMAGVRMLHIPFKGSPEAVTSVMKGESTVMFPNIANALELTKAGSLKMLAVTTRQRLSWLPDVPTLSESGLPGFEAVAWFGFVGPAGTPKAVVDRLNKESQAVLNKPDVQRQLVAQGFEVMGGSPDDFGRFITAEVDKWTKIVKASGIPQIE